MDKLENLIGTPKNVKTTTCGINLNVCQYAIQFDYVGCTYKEGVKCLYKEGNPYVVTVLVKK